MTAPDPKILDNLALAIGQTHGTKPAEFIPAEAPFDPEQRHWLNGLLSGLHAIASAASVDAGGAAEAGTALTILYGSQAGNAEGVSKDLKKFAKTQGFDATLAALDDVQVSDLSAVNHLLIVSCTQNGLPPDNAKKFCEALMDDGAPELPATLNYSVLGLGDSSYVHFNKVPGDIDARLAELGATRASDAMLCDTDYDDDYATWRSAAFESDPFKSAAGAAAAPEPGGAAPGFDKNHPFMATLMVSERLSGEASAKCVNHVELSLAGGGEDLDYEVGDALGVWPLNCPMEVGAILKVCGFTGKEPVSLKSGPANLRSALLTRLDLTTITPKTIEAWGLGTPGDDDQIIDILTVGVPDLDPQKLVDGLRALAPRLYSISSSPKAHPGEVHLTVCEVRYDLHDTARKGCASTYLGERLAEGGSIGVYVQKSAHFHIPEDDNVPLIMIGPGTGIAPFRAFLEERAARGAEGRNWLFFGDQHEACDYLYRDQIEAWQAAGVVDRVSLAWSRDGAEKVYVQTLLKKDGAEVFRWLEEGAAIFICGDASRMAADVDAALRGIVAEHGEMSADEADAYMDALIAGHRYQRDVY